MGRHEFLEAIAVADCAVEIAGNDLDDLFATAARALAEVMVDPATVRATTERRLELAAPRSTSCSTTGPGAGPAPA